MQNRTMKKTLTILILLQAFLTYAQDTANVVQLDEVNVLENHNTLISEKLRVVYTITRQEIASLPTQDINELLDYLPGIDVRQRGVGGTQADLSMRGGTFDQVLVLLNGVNITDVQTGHYSLDIPVLLNQIDRIEILQGTSMSLFGLSAFSGAINIITEQNAENKISAAIVGGDNGLFTPSIKGNFLKNKWNFMGAYSHSSSGGYIRNTDFSNNNVFLQAHYKDKKNGKINFQLGGQTKNYGANSFYSLAYPEQFEAVKTLIASAQWEKLIKNFSLNSSLFYRRHHDRFELFREGTNNLPAWYKSHNYHQTDVFGANFKTAYYTKISKTAVGIELRNEHIFSNVLGDLLDSPHKILFENTDTAFTYGKNRMNINYFAEQAFFIKKFSASAGISGNYNSMFKNNFAFGINLGYEFLKNSHLYLNLNRALRLPTFTDLYYKSATQISNPNLKPENSMTLEFGTKYLVKHFRSNISAFYRMGRDIIDWIKLPQEVKWQSVNHTEINTLGGEFSASLFGFHWIKNIEINYSYIHADKIASEYISKYALDYLQHKATIRLEHHIWKSFGATWQFAFQKRNGSFEDASKQIVNYKSFKLFDGKIYWQSNTTKIFIEATNILNTKYFDYGGIIQPQRWIRVGIELKLGK